MNQITMRVVFVILVCFSVLGCTSNRNHQPQTISSIPISELPREADFIFVGYIGSVFEVKGTSNSISKFKVPPGNADELLADTIRLYRFEPKEANWVEIANSRYNPEQNELTSAAVKPGFYTAFGWSADPAVNVFQRIALDTSMGYHAFLQPPAFEALSSTANRLPVQQFRENAIRTWFEANFTYPIRSCHTNDIEGCPALCRAIAKRPIILRSCRVDGIDCDVPTECCDCVEGTFTERLKVPQSFLVPDIIVCSTMGIGLPCAVCPYGLSCPTGSFAKLSKIKPTLPVPNYSFLNDLGLGVIVDDEVIRESLHTIVESVTGNKYPVPPPWP